MTNSAEHAERLAREAYEAFEHVQKLAQQSKSSSAVDRAAAILEIKNAKATALIAQYNLEKHLRNG